ncbi:5'-methylthioadenosine/adenosylhomocysteine nucleosidase [Olsenella urininfantis]|uniref:5'-methylthioadenosine/adenosylhomocysteine nucleosidase n=1 Tax=Olsenella urininfantis TaxID=1871033 RepID=UPI0009870EC3|nr:5'-methylthioadenosine/adenosylhomocysteine nucleosidase [Olsenella urininfantis]
MKLGIIGAMDVEVALLKEHLADARQVRRAGMEFSEGSLAGLPVVVVRCGVGKVNAALCAQVLADLFEVTHVVNTGVAGSLDNAIDIGDVVVSVDAVHHDMDVSALGYATGQVPGLPVLAFPADLLLRQTALAAAAEVASDIRAFEGRVASGDQFIGSAKRREEIAACLHARCAEMEGASIAHACWLNGVPFVVVRAISDKADGSSTVDYPSFERSAAEHCARIVERMAAALACE